MGLQKELELQNEIEYLHEQRNRAYTERNQCVAILGRILQTLGFVVGMGEDLLSETGFRNVFYIDAPIGQISWHIPDHDLCYFQGFPPYTREWDGHTTIEKHTRLLNLCADLLLFPRSTKQPDSVLLDILLTSLPTTRKERPLS